MITIIIFGLEVLSTIIDFFATYYQGVDSLGQVQHAVSEIEYFSFLDVIQIILTIMLMHMLFVYTTFVQKVVKRDDPFNNAAIFIFIIFMVVLQKYLIELTCLSLFPNKDIDELIVVIRQTVMSIELLFV